MLESSGGKGSQIGLLFKCPESAEKWIEGKLIEVFLHFCQIFAKFDDFLKSSAILTQLKISKSSAIFNPAKNIRVFLTQLKISVSSAIFNPAKNTPVFSKKYTKLILTVASK